MSSRYNVFPLINQNSIKNHFTSRLSNSLYKSVFPQAVAHVDLPDNHDATSANYQHMHKG
jgi:hypothetical protein